MHVVTAIRERRTIHEFLPGPVEPAILQRLLEAGLWAPNHKLTQPWGFIQIGPETRAHLAELAAGAAASTARPGSDAASIAELQEKTRNKLLARPTIVAVTCRRSADTVREQEDRAAVAVAMQNIQLAAWAEGIGTKWSTGKVIRLPATATLLGFDPAQEEIMGLLFFGQPAEIPAPKARKPLAEVLRVLP